jgi:hypothetical protein
MRLAGTGQTGTWKYSMVYQRKDVVIHSDVSEFQREVGKQGGHRIGGL